MPSGTPNLNDDQAAALKAAIEKRHPDEEAPRQHVLDERKEATLDSPPLTVAEAVVTELDKLPDVNNTQRKIAYLLSRDWSGPEIAVKVGCTAAYVRALRADPRIQKLIEFFKGGAVYDFAENISSTELLDRAAVRAAEILAEKANYALEESNQIRAAIEILKLTKHYENEEGARVHITIGRDKVDIYEQARQEVLEAEVIEE